MPLGPPMALCSPVGGKGRLVPTTWVSLLMAEMIEAPMRMLAHIRASTLSRGGKEGIDGTGVSRRPEAHRVWASFFKYYSFVDKVIIYINHQPQRAGRFYCFFKRANNAMVMPPPPPPLSVGDSRYSVAEPKARRPLDPVLPPTH